MSNPVNPYHAGRPVENPAMFFGRDDALVWIEQQITLNRHLLIVHGPDLIGKTSLVRRLPGVLPEDLHYLYFECKPFQDEPASRVLAALAGELVRQLTEQGLVSPHQVDTVADSGAAVKSLLQQAARALDTSSSSPQKLLLILDDVHWLTDDIASSLKDFLDSLESLLTEIPSLFLLLTLSDLAYGRLSHSLLANAVAFRLGPLNGAAAQQLITQPIQGTYRFDGGVVKRIADINSNHPYYLHLFCYTMYSSRGREGWINQSDVDAVLHELLSLPNERFESIWQQSGRQEQAVLAAMAGLRGVHGPIMRQEVITHLQGLDPEVDQQVILDALESLAERGVLIRMGALSYRFALTLFRYWLDRHTDAADVLAGLEWHRPKRQASAERAVAVATEEDEEESQRQGIFGRAFIWTLAGTALIGAVLLALAFTGVLPAGIIIGPTPTTSRPETSTGFVTPTATPTPTPVPTPTPTKPVVVARSLPAIVYMARGTAGGSGPSTWQIFVMGADGTNRRQLLQSSSDDITPTWSPDGRRIAFVSQRDGDREIYVVNADGSGLVNISQHAGEDWTPAWSPDGQKIAWASNRQGNWEIFIANLDGSDLKQITSDGAGSLSPIWSPDGQTVAYSSKQGGDWELYTMPSPNLDSEIEVRPRRLTFSSGNDLSPLFSPQGDLIAFESNREGNVEIFVAKADGSNPKNITNLPYADDHGPIWSPDGQRLAFYSNREGNWDLFVMTSAGDSVVNLTNTPDVDEQAPAWRP